MKSIFKPPFADTLRPGIRYLIAITIPLMLLAGCGGVEKLTLNNGSTSGPVNPLRVASTDFLISGGQSCSSTLVLTNPDPQSYQFTYQYDGLNASGQTIATVVFQNTIDPNTTHQFNSSWQTNPALNIPANNCNGIVDKRVNGIPSASQVTPVAVMHLDTDGFGRAAFSGVWTSRGATPAWAISIDSQGRIFGQSERGCVLEGAIGQATEMNGIFPARFNRTLCGRDERFTGVVLVDPDAPLNLYLWSRDAQDQQFNLVATR